MLARTAAFSVWGALFLRGAARESTTEEWRGVLNVKQFETGEKLELRESLIRLGAEVARRAQARRDTMRRRRQDRFDDELVAAAVEPVWQGAGGADVGRVDVLQ